ncbi:hypothetical protein EGW08_002603, partial [Elysia chlorotica]
GGKSGGKREQKRRPKPRDGTVLFCGVCGDRALGYNFDAISCESCKAFFRRNALKTKPFTCSFDGNCKLDAHTRKFCSGCRMKKCFAVGMKKEWILTLGGEPIHKRLKIEGPGHQLDSSFYMEPVPSSQLQSLNKSITASPEHLAQSPVVKSEPLTGTEEYAVPLSPYIKDMLNQLHSVYTEIFEAAYALDYVPKLTDNPKTADELFNMTDIFIRRLIKFAKTLPEFKNLEQSDQIQLLKGGIMEMFLLRSAMGFDSKSRGWKFKFQNEPCESAKVKEGKLDSKVLNTLGSSMVVSHITFVQQLQEVTRKDRLVLMLLFVIELMSPDRPNLENHILVAKCQERHLVWLRAYLESTMPVVEAQEVYPRLLEKLHDVRLLSDESGHLTSSLEISKLAPLLVE